MEKKMLTDEKKLLVAELALTELTDECHGSCHWETHRTGDKMSCSCQNFWLSINTIRKLLKREESIA